MIVKDNNSFKIKSSCYTKFIRDNKVGIKLDIILGETQTIETSISESVEKQMERK